MRKIIYIFLFSCFCLNAQTTTLLNKFLADATLPSPGRVYVDHSANGLAGTTPTVRYVSVSGSGTKDGTSASNSWTLTTALSSAVAGALVWVKAGSYSTFTQSNNGTLSNPIKFVGYKTVPGDINSVDMSTFSRTNTSTFPTSTDFPRVNGTDAAASYCVVNGNYVQFENFAIGNLEIGLVSNGSNVYYKNVITWSCNTGMQMSNTTTKFTLQNCFTFNNGSNGIMALGNYGHIFNSIAWSDTTTVPEYPTDANSGMGYFFFSGHLGGNSHDNVFEGCTAYRIPSTSGGFGGAHQGHGFILKQKAFDNIFRNCVTYNTGIESNFGDVYDNIYQDMEMYGDLTNYPAQLSPGIRILNGAHDNLYKNIYMYDVKSAIELNNFDDGLAGADLTQGGNYNNFVNMIVNKFKYVILTTDSESSGAGTSTGNKVYNSVFYSQSGGGPYFVDYHQQTGTKYINCHFEGGTTGYEWQGNNGVTKGYSFENCNFYDISYSTPSGTSITTINPLFIDAGANMQGFKLQAGSTIIGIGQNTSFNADFIGNERFNNSFDIGAFQYGSTPPAPIYTNSSKKKSISDPFSF